MTASAAAGAAVHRGSLADLESLQRGAAAADAVIHTAFIHDFTDFAASARVDQRAIEAMTATLAGSGKPFIVTAGTLGLPPGRPGTEDDKPASSMPRRSEAAGLAAAAQGVRAMVIRLPPSVHGDGDHGFVPALIQLARERGFAMYVGDGRHRWPAVHRLDAARVYRLALEQGSAGAVFHAIADEGIPVREIAERLGISRWDQDWAFRWSMAKMSPTQRDEIRVVQQDPPRPAAARSLGRPARPRPRPKGRP